MGFCCLLVLEVSIMKSATALNISSPSKKKKRDGERYILILLAKRQFVNLFRGERGRFPFILGFILIIYLSKSFRFPYMEVNLLSQLIPQRWLRKEIFKVQKHKGVKIHCIWHTEYVLQMLKQRRNFSWWSLREGVWLGAADSQFYVIRISPYGKM